MRRALIFVLVLGLGLGLLFWLRRREQEVTIRPAVPPVAQRAPPGLADVPLDAERAPDEAVQVGISGKLEASIYPAREPEAGALPETTTRRRLYHIVAEDSRTLGGDEYELDDARLELFDAEDGELVATMLASRVRLHLSLAGGELRADREEDARLWDVEVTLLRNAPVVPMTVRVPYLQGAPDPGRFRSKDRVQILAEGLEAQGLGLELDLAGQRFALEREGRVDLDLESGERATLEAVGDGPIEVDRLEEQDLLELRASEGARAVFRGTDEYEIGGRTILLRGPLTRGQPFRARDALVDGQAVLSGQGHVFRSAQAELSFDEKGDPSEARLSGEPTGSLRIGPYLAGRDPQLYAERAEVAGGGPLVVSLGEQIAVRLDGPGSILVPEKRLAVQAGGAIRARLAGRDPAAAAESSFSAEGGVRVTLDDRELTSDAVEVEHSIAQGVERSRLTTRGATQITGADELGRALVLDAGGGATLEAEGRRRIVREARDVRLQVLGEEGFVARADRVRDLDLERRTFEAEGDVLYEVADGRGRAEKVSAADGRTVVLVGSAATPASFELWNIEAPEAEGRIKSARASARRIELHSGAVRARGEVVADVLTTAEALRLESEELDLDYDDPPREGQRRFTARARGAVTVREESDRGVGRLGGELVELRGVLAQEGATPSERVSNTSLSARGAVWFDWRERGGLWGTGDLFTVSPEGRARLSAGLGRRVRAVGVLGAGGQAYEVTADWIEVDDEGVEAGNPAIGPAADVQDAGLFLGKGRDGSPATAQRQGSGQLGVLAMRGRRFVGRRGVVVLEGDAHVDGALPDGEPWSVDAGVIEVHGRWDETTRRLQLEDVESIEARNGFEGRLGRRLYATGRRMRAEGSRLDIEGLPGRLEFLDLAWTSNWIQFDRERLLIATGKGKIGTRNASDPLHWTIEYESMQPFDDVDATILAVRQPVFRSGDARREIRSSWALAWIDRQRWQRSTREFLGVEGEQGAQQELFVPTPPLDRSESSGDLELDPEQERLEDMFQLVREIYLEGNIEFLEAERRLGRASAMYLDRYDGNGWLYEADVLIDLEVSDRPQTLRAQAEWMRLSADMRTRRLDPLERVELLEAQKAVISFCEFDEPDYVIETGELRIERAPRSPLGFKVSARKNKARLKGFGTNFEMPLPPLGSDEEGNFSLAGLEFGNSARFGNVLQLGASFTLSEGMRESLGGVFQSEKEEVRGTTRFQVGWLGSRGPLLGIGQTVGISDRLWLTGRVDGIPDGGEDKGLVRVPEDERDTLRLWVNSRGRLYRTPDEWLDLAFNYQRDAGIQSEFYEGEFTYYEERDNFLHWRKADSQYLLNATAKVRLESFRSDVEELPKLGFQRGLTPLFDLGDRPLLFTSDVQAAYLRRREGTAPFSPFGPGLFPDGLGEREVLRVDSPNRVEYPLPIGWGGLVLTPFATLRGTVWNEGVEQQDPAARIESFAGAEVATTFWRRWGDTYVHELTPSVGVRSELFDEQDGDRPVFFDGRDLDVDGEIVDLALRSVWRRPGLDPIKSERLDVEVRGSWSSELDGNGFLPVGVLGSGLYFLDDVPIGLTHDGRYDFNSGDTVYSATGLGFEPHPRWTFGAGYSQGRDASLATLYRSTGFSVRFRATPKWTLEWAQTFGLLEGTGDESRVVVRRFGHDFVTELQLDQRTGEGFSIGIGVRPLVGWRPTPIGLIDDWLGLWR